MRPTGRTDCPTGRTLCMLSLSLWITVQLRWRHYVQLIIIRQVQSLADSEGAKGACAPPSEASKTLKSTQNEGIFYVNFQIFLGNDPQTPFPWHWSPPKSHTCPLLGRILDPPLVLHSEISNQISDRGVTCDVSFKVSHEVVGILAWLRNFVSDQFHLKLVGPSAEICARPMCESCCCKHCNAELHPFRISCL